MTARYKLFEQKSLQGPYLQIDSELWYHFSAAFEILVLLDYLVRAFLKHFSLIHFL